MVISCDLYGVIGTVIALTVLGAIVRGILSLFTRKDTERLESDTDEKERP